MFQLFEPQVDVAMLIFRVSLGILMFLHGIPKLRGHKGTAGYFKSIGIPFPEFSAWMSFIVETLGSIMVILGLFTQVFAFLVFANMIVATWASIFKDKLTIIIDNGKSGWEMPALYLFGFLIIFLIGPGSVSLDSLLF